MLTFDENGHITPDEPVIVDYETFVREFVVNDHRAEIFSEYKRWLHLFSTDRQRRKKGFIQINF